MLVYFFDKAISAIYFRSFSQNRLAKPQSDVFALSVLRGKFS